jgi:hypothetical protein
MFPYKKDEDIFFRCKNKKLWDGFLRENARKSGLNGEERNESIRNGYLH